MHTHPSNLDPVVLARRAHGEPEEWSVAANAFPISETVVGLQGRLVIGRYSVLPFYDEVARGCALQGSRLINSLEAHRFIADASYLAELDSMTPASWFDLADVPKAGGPYVVKGRTNSRKLRWNEQMFAPTFADAVRIGSTLLGDHEIQQQGLCIRAYEPLRIPDRGLFDLPFANEWRCFFYGTTLPAHGFYWAHMTEQMGTWTAAAEACARAAAARLAPCVPFFVVDVAEAAQGHWIVIEVNDGQMAGLSGVDPAPLYANLKAAIAAGATNNELAP
jgi:hypothetical protein